MRDLQLPATGPTTQLLEASCPQRRRALKVRGGRLQCGYRVLVTRPSGGVDRIRVDVHFLSGGFRAPLPVQARCRRQTDRPPAGTALRRFRRLVNAPDLHIPQQRRLRRY